MEHRRKLGKSKRLLKGMEMNFWDCSVCTYRNTAEAFKCLMCDVRKGMSYFHVWAVKIQTRLSNQWSWNKSKIINPLNPDGYYAQSQRVLKKIQYYVFKFFSSSQIPWGLDEAANFAIKFVGSNGHRTLFLVFC